jgi:DNA polymerase-1
MRTLLFDGHNCLWRTANAMPELRSKGQPVQVVYGFLKLIRTALDKFSPDQAFVCWDEGLPTYRKSLFPGYKQRRHESNKEDKKRRDAVYAQMAVIKNLLPLLGVKQVSYPNTEGDDLIGTACQMKELGLRIVISGDKDFLQLVQRGVRVWSPNHEYLYRWTNFKKKLGMTPQQWIEYRSILGEPDGDEIPRACPGLGEKSAILLIKKYKTIENVFRHKKQVKRLGTKYKKFLSEQTSKNLNLNHALMQLHKVHNQKELTAVIRATQCKPLNAVAVKKEFLSRSFISLLEGFGEWITPFKNLK